MIYFGANSDDVGMGTTSADSLFGGAGNDTLSGASPCPSNLSLEKPVPNGRPIQGARHQAPGS
ncbi:hypothetical protein [Pseudomonas amygdali]|uniref:hypothetical protein n=1 Tax=Pseudomonas amygdali TaxID=47877 RepID=UPI0039C936F5